MFVTEICSNSSFTYVSTENNISNILSSKHRMNDKTNLLPFIIPCYRCFQTEEYNFMETVLYICMYVST